ncbi:MAG: peptide-methionine (S)-S-oxide reductase MsrA [Flavobacteriales bacterium]
MSSTFAQHKATETATFGAGCFWCIEAVFQEIHGVSDVKSGFTGGKVLHPSYKEVCSGTTGHAEVIQLTFDPNIVSYTDLLEVFFSVHNPTTLNRQGNDVGTQYRSVIFYHNTNQKTTAKQVIKTLDDSKVYSSKIVTTLQPETTFYLADTSHQDYYTNNAEQGYCALVIQPKVEKFRKVFKTLLKK